MHAMKLLALVGALSRQIVVHRWRSLWDKEREESLEIENTQLRVCSLSAQVGGAREEAFACSAACLRLRGVPWCRIYPECCWQGSTRLHVGRVLHNAEAASMTGLKAGEQVVCSTKALMKSIGVQKLQVCASAVCAPSDGSC